MAWHRTLGVLTQHACMRACMKGIVSTERAHHVHVALVNILPHRTRVTTCKLKDNYPWRFLATSPGLGMPVCSTHLNGLQLECSFQSVLGSQSGRFCQTNACSTSGGVVRQMDEQRPPAAVLIDDDGELNQPATLHGLSKLQVSKKRVSYDQKDDDIINTDDHQECHSAMIIMLVTSLQVVGYLLEVQHAKVYIICIILL